MSPLSFYALTVHEATLILEGHNEKMEQDYNLLMTAMYNANGVFHGGKKFKMLKPFDKKSTEKKARKTTVEEHNEILNFLKNKFK